MATEKLRLGGRDYVPATNTTVRQDSWLISHANHCGLLGIEIKEGETPEEFGHRILSKAVSAGRASYLMAGLVVPVGARWSADEATRIALAFDEIIEPEEKKQFYSALLSALFSFFQDGLGPWTASLPAFGPGDEPDLMKIPAGGRGKNSSAPSPDTTTTDSSA